VERPAPPTEVIATPMGSRMFMNPSGPIAAFRRHLATRKDHKGQSLLEFALVLPLLLLIFSGAADLGRVFYNQIALENAVKEGALYGARFPLCDAPSALCMDPNTVLWHVQHETRSQTGPATYASLVTPTMNECQTPAGVKRAQVKDCVEGDTYVVRAELTFDPITPMLSNILGRITLRSESRAIVINQAFDPTPGLAPTKLIFGTNARNNAELAAKCQQPDPIGSPGFYRSPCQDVTAVDPGTMVKAVFRMGDILTYKVIVRNNGGTAVTNVTIDDSLGWPLICPIRPTSMAVGATPYTCQYTRIAADPGAVAADVTNIVTVTGTEILPVTDTVIVSVEKPPADLRVYKYVSVYPLGDDGDGTPNFGFTKALPVSRVTGRDPVVYYKVVVQNIGGLTATGFNLTDTNGALPYGSPTCPAKPASIAAGGSYTCIYPKTLTTDQVLANTVVGTATNVTPDAGDTDTATVTVTTCAPPQRLVPVLVGLTNVSGLAAWGPSGAGFNNGTFTSVGTGTLKTQSRQAWSCLDKASLVVVTTLVTP
jgi:hypothetical protein